MSKYIKTNWVNYVTPINESNMNHIEEGIYDNNNNLSQTIELNIDDTTITQEQYDLVLNCFNNNIPLYFKRDNLIYKLINHNSVDDVYIASVFNSPYLYKLLINTNLHLEFQIINFDLIDYVKYENVGDAKAIYLEGDNHNLLIANSENNSLSDYSAIQLFDDYPTIISQEKNNSQSKASLQVGYDIGVDIYQNNFRLMNCNTTGFQSQAYTDTNNYFSLNNNKTSGLSFYKEISNETFHLFNIDDLNTSFYLHNINSSFGIFVPDTNGVFDSAFQITPYKDDIHSALIGLYATDNDTCYISLDGENQEIESIATNVDLSWQNLTINSFNYTKGLQSASILKRVQDEIYHFGSLDDFTDLFIYRTNDETTEIFLDFLNVYQIKNWFISNGCIVKQGTSDISAINIDLVNYPITGNGATIPYDVIFIGFTSENIPMFKRYISDFSTYLQKEDVINSLDSTSTDKPLAANQGKELKEYINSHITGIYHFQGSVDFASLPSTLTQAEIGYVWNVTDTFTTDTRFLIPNIEIAAGSNIAVILSNNEYKFDILGSVFDMSKYYTKAEMDTSLNNKVNKTSLSYKIYGVEANGTPKLLPWSYGANASSIPIRNASGCIIVGNNPELTETPNRQWIENKISELPQFTHDASTDFISSTAPNKALSLTAPIVSIEVKDSNNTTVSKLSLVADQNQNVFMPFQNDAVNLGTAAYKFKDLFTNKINNLDISQGIQTQTKRKRVQNEEFHLTDDTYTDIFVYQAEGETTTIVLDDGFTGANLKTFVISTGCTIKQGTSTINAININLANKFISGTGFVTTELIYLIGWVSDTVMLFKN